MEDTIEALDSMSAEVARQLQEDALLITSKGEEETETPTCNESKETKRSDKRKSSSFESKRSLNKVARPAEEAEDVPFVTPKGKEETADNESKETKKSNKRKSSSSGSKRSSKKVARLAEEAKRQQEEAAKAENRQHEIDLARAKHPDAEILVKDCTINLICNDSESEPLRSAVIKAASAMKTSE